MTIKKGLIHIAKKIVRPKFNVYKCHGIMTIIKTHTQFTADTGIITQDKDIRQQYQI
jgi:hypothetical protein